MAPNIEAEENVIRQIGNLFEQTLSRPPPSNIIDLWKEHLEIRKIIENVSELQRKLSKTDERLAISKRTPEAIQQFLEWADKIGVGRNNVDVVRSKKHGLELKSHGNIPKHHIVVKVPRHAMISLDLARKSAVLKKAFERDPIIGGMGNVGLALFVAAQWINEAQSKWHSYISVMPTTFSTPMFYSEEQLLQLKPSPIFEESLLFYRTIVRQYCYFLIAIAKNRVYENVQKNKSKTDKDFEPPVLYNTPFTVANFTPKLYMWAVGIVTTRVNMVPSEIEKTEKGEVVMMPALIPVLDMANHENLSDAPNDLVCFSQDDNCAVITAHSDISPGDSVTIFYGRRSNGEHLLHNGFVPAHENSFDALKLKIGIPKTDKDLEAKRKLIEELVPSAWSSSNIFHFELINYPKQPFSEDLEIFASIFVTASPNKSKIESAESRKKGNDFLKNRFLLLKQSYGQCVSNELLEKTGFEGDIVRLKKSEIHILELAIERCLDVEKNL